MAKVTEMKKKTEKEPFKHDRHNYAQVVCVEQGYNKATKDKSGVDGSKMYTTIFCTICGETKEIVAASNLHVPEIPEEDDEVALPTSKV